MKRKVKAADKNLPPEKYWHKPVAKNKNGYYELTFGAEHNGHRMIYLPGKKIWIDRYEVSNGQFGKFLKDLNQSQMAEIPGKTSSKLIHDGDEFPAVVTYEKAGKYCKQYGLRLPRLDEWEYAAGKEISTHPWGNELPGKKGIWPANFDSLDDEGGIERDGFEGTAPVKSFESFASPFGVVNAAGNVWEWVQGRMLKGGSFFSAPKDLMIKNSVAGRSKDTHGFRCVKDEN